MSSSGSTASAINKKVGIIFSHIGNLKLLHSKRSSKGTIAGPTATSGNAITTSSNSSIPISKDNVIINETIYLGENKPDTTNEYLNLDKDGTLVIANEPRKS